MRENELMEPRATAGVHEYLRRIEDLEIENAHLKAEVAYLEAEIAVLQAKPQIAKEQSELSEAINEALRKN